MHRLKLLLIWATFAAVLGYGVYLGYLGWLTTNGYCHAQGKYLTDDEKIRVALVDLLSKYPPAVVLGKHHPDAKVLGYLSPQNPIHYRDVDDFLSLNPDCCIVGSTSGEPRVTNPEDIGPANLIETLMGTATRAIEVTYLVRFKDANDVAQSIRTTGWLHISNCGTPAKPWTPH